ncbi:MAG: gfo/Idh/MocA family oxidoreductase, partial [Planctomycetota bacterium]
MQTSDLRFGLVGYGLWGTHHAGAIEKTRGARLAAIAERSEEGRAAAKKAHPEVDIYDDYR